MNDVQINHSTDTDIFRDDDRLILIDKNYNSKALSDAFLNAKVAYIENDECVPDTVIIGIHFNEEEK